MEVRCERCQTECKVENTGAAGLGGEVHCSDCGHVMVIGNRPPPAIPSHDVPTTPKPDASEWLVETVHGRSLRSPDLATLHRWIIERRVTREDRISRDGKVWQHIGEMPDLVPFFDIVDSAERARRADTPGPMLLPPTPPAATGLAAQTQGSATLAGGAFPEVEDRSETKVVVAPRSRFRLPARLGLTTLVAAVVAFAGISLHNYRSSPQEVSPSSLPGAQSAGKPPSPLTPPPPIVEPVAAEEAAEPSLPAVEASAAPAERGGSRALARKKSRGANRSVAARGSRASAATAAHRSNTVASAPASAAPQTLAAQGYAAFNRRQFPHAIELFKQALAGNPSNGTALFGLAEAYRESGQKSLALKCYRRYVHLLPSGPDAGQSRLQIRLLEKSPR